MCSTCRDKGVEPPPPHIPTIVLSADSVGITEVRLRVQFTDMKTPRTFSLYRNGKPLLLSGSLPSDTIIADTALLRGHTYVYRAYRMLDQIPVDSSDLLSLRTLDTASIRLSAVDILVKEVGLQIVLADRNPLRGFRLVRNGTILFTGNLIGTDTVVFDNGLSPGANYIYKAFRLADSSAVDSSMPVTVKTLDTTSHNFTWQINTLGDGNSSVINDVAIINDTLVYVVGEVYLKDSTGQFDPNAYNLLKWNGRTWDLMRIQFLSFCGQSYTGSYPASAIFAFSAQDVWIASGSQIVRWNGQAQTSPFCIPISVNKLWGENSNSLYAVGNGGGIAHFDGSTWQKFESGTTRGINDVWGIENPLNKNEEVYCAVTAVADPQNSWILRVTNGTRIDSVQWDAGREIVSVWTYNGFPLYVCGDGMFENSQGHWNEIRLGTSVFTNRVRGDAPNNIFIVGYFGLIAHFNGADWNVFFEDADFLSVAVKGNIVVAVGSLNDRAAVAIGRRN